MHDFIFIIQARTNSTRLPGKMLKNFYESKVILEIIIDRLNNFFPDIPVVLATTDTVNDDKLVNRLKERCIIVRGSENDVLQRFIDVQTYVQSKAIIRVCADNPFIDVKFIKELINNWNNTLDYLSHKIIEKPVIKTGVGMFCEITTFGALKKVKKLASKPIYLEHVTNYIYEHSNSFKINWLQVDGVLDKFDIRLTVDTMTDFKITKIIYNDLCKLYDRWGCKEVLEYMNESDFLELMKKGNEQNGK